MAARRSNQNGDQKLLDRWSNNFPQYRCWRPESPYSLINPKGSHYVKLEDIERIVHFEDFEDMYRERSITPHPIQESSHSSMPFGIYCSWFGIPSPAGEHSWYGNVSFKVNFSKFLLTFKPRCYFVETVEFRTTAQPRLLFTTKTMPFMNNLVRYNAFQYGGPWYRDRDGCDYYLSDCRRFNNQGNNDFEGKPEFIIHLGRHEYETLYDMCSIGPVNHNKANENTPLSCKKYHPQTCPTPWNANWCNVKLNELYDSE